MKMYSLKVQILNGRDGAVMARSNVNDVVKHVHGNGEIYVHSCDSHLLFTKVPSNMCSKHLPVCFFLPSGTEEAHGN